MGTRRGPTRLVVVIHGDWKSGCPPHHMLAERPEPHACQALAGDLRGSKRLRLGWGHKAQGLSTRLHFCGTPKCGSATGLFQGTQEV